MPQFDLGECLYDAEYANLKVHTVTEKG